MKEVMRSNDAIRRSWATAMLRGEGIEVVELDRHASVLDGSVLAIQRRLMVDDEDFDHAARILRDAEADLDR